MLVLGGRDRNGLLQDVWRSDDRGAAWEQLAQAPDQYRAEIFHLGGRVRRVDKVRVSEELAKQSEFQDYYRVMFQLDGASHPVLICTRNVSEAWTSPTGGGLTMNERASAFGLFLKAGAIFVTALTGLHDPMIVNIVMTVLIVMVLIYTILGGMVSVVITDYIQFVVLSIGMALGVYFVLTDPNLGWATITTTKEAKASRHHG